MLSFLPGPSWPSSRRCDLRVFSASSVQGSCPLFLARPFLFSSVVFSVSPRLGPAPAVLRPARPARGNLHWVPRYQANVQEISVSLAASNSTSTSWLLELECSWGPVPARCRSFSFGVLEVFAYVSITSLPYSASSRSRRVSSSLFHLPAEEAVDSSGLRDATGQEFKYCVGVSGGLLVSLLDPLNQQSSPLGSFP